MKTMFAWAALVAALGAGSLAWAGGCEGCHCPLGKVVYQLRAAAVMKSSLQAAQTAKPAEVIEILAKM